MKTIKARLSGLLLLGLGISSCVSQQETKTKCGSIMCTDEFIMIHTAKRSPSQEGIALF